MSAFALVFLPLLVAYATALGWCWDRWWQEGSYFAHGVLVPPAIAWVIWARRAHWRLAPARWDGQALWLLAPALALHLGGAALTIDSLSAASMILAVPAAAWLALGRERLQGLWPALWLFAFAVPLPIYVTGRLAFELKEVAVDGGVALAQASGLAIERSGAWLQVPGQPGALDVADPCGGLRSLLAMVTLVYCVAFFLGPQRLGRQAVLLALAAPLALFVNVLRITAICWLAHGFGVPFATGTGHEVLNAIAWALDLGIVIAVDALLSRRHVTPAATPPAAGPAAATIAPSAVPRGAGITLWALSLVLLLLSVYRPYTPSRGRAAALPPALGAFQQTAEHPLTQRTFQLLGTDDAVWRSYRDSAGQELFVVALFHAQNWKSVHPPHICLLGSDMEIMADGAIPLVDGDGDEIGRILLRTRRDGRLYLSLYAYGARGLCTGSYARFFLYHAPRALFRASNDGFLLRVETYADGPGGVDAAEARCRALLQELLQRARGLLP